jgi:hypothetical protein
MKGKLLLVLGLFLFSITALKGEEKDSIRNFHVSQKSVYPFIIQDSPSQIFTMRQLDEDYLSGYRLYSRTLGNCFSPAVNYAIQAVTGFLFFIPMTHEEAHRSVLSTKNIGSIARPFFFSERRGYVYGVTDATLKNLRDTDFPTYSRLHSAGLESDYMLAHREEELFAFEQEKFSNLAVEYLLRKAMILQYYLMGFAKLDVDGVEETDELLRDIVGNDIYGNIRHLYRPTMIFQRYTRYADLTSPEISYLHKIGYRSLLNLVNLNIIGIPNLPLSANTSINFGLGHIMCPFGDFIDENVWITYRKKLLVETYIREYQNNQRWFIAGGIGIKDFPLGDKFISSVNLHVWDQPANLGFNDASGKLGGAVEWVGRYFFVSGKKKQNKAISLDLGLIYKTSGYLPEEIVMQEHFGIRVGTSIALDK